MAFKLPSTAAASLESPEALANDLRPRRVHGPLAHQSDVLRDYAEHAANAATHPDVAIQLPTGSGKTYVGLLIGEWRRRKHGERVVYLCPTNQLVHQVADQANTLYGMHVVGFTGPRAEYPVAARTAYLSGDALAVTSYSALFNVNPFFDDPHTIILDDAHAAEQYIASHWSLRVVRREHETVYDAILALLRNVFSVTDVQRLVTGGASRWDETWVDKVPTPTLAPLIPELVALLDEHVQGTDLRYSWQVIRDHVAACHLYASPREFLLRPLVPPTTTHAPFAGARQRIYMSATLGAGGELERLAGRRTIHRLAVPRGWDKQGIGRRLFLFPGSSLDEGAIDDLRANLIREAGRALVLTPDEATAQQMRDWVETTLGFPTFNAREIEQSKQPFVSEDEAVAVVANRYDGIDFKDEECRLEFVRGLPRAITLQERFLVSRLGAGVLLDDRIITRVVQAVGRCTRAPTDFATVVIEDEELHKYLLSRDRRAYMHPELQAELAFGIEQSSQTSAADFLENVRIFSAQGEEWQAANDAILRHRETATASTLPGTVSLRSAVAHEVAYQEAVWAGDYLGALESGRRVLTALTDSEVQPYRALWNYLAGSAAWLADGGDGGTLAETARSYFASAASASFGVPWLHQLARFTASTAVDAESATSSRLATLIERLERELERLGTVHDRRFDRREREVLDGLTEKDATKFEAAQEALGRLLGYDAGNRESSAAPDPWWLVDEASGFVFEDHSNADATGAIGAEKIRQAAGHPNWIRAELPVSSNAQITAILVTPVTAVDRGAVPHLGHLQYWGIDDFREWAKEALATVRALRRTFPGPGDLAWRAEAIAQFQAKRLGPEGIMEQLRPAQDALTPR